MFMGLLQDLRNKRNERTLVERNTETLRRELGRDLSKDDLSDMIRLMNEPEVYKPLFENVEAFGRQPELDDVLRTQFRMKTSDILGGDSKQLNAVMERFNDSSKTYETTKDTQRLSDKLVLSGRDDTVSVTDRIAQRIQATRQDINDRVAHQQEKLKNVSRSIERKVKPLTGVAHDSIKGMLQGVKDRVQTFKDDYRTRQITIENAHNWEKALDKGVTAEQIRNVIDHAEYPEIRYGVMQHASKLFQQDAMTPELATDLFYAYQPHTNAQNQTHERFYKTLETYANEMVEGVNNQVGGFDAAVAINPSNADKALATTTLMRYALSREGQSTDVSPAVQNELDNRLSFSGYNKDGDNVWVHHTTDGETVSIDDDYAANVAMDVYAAVSKVGRPAEKPANAYYLSDYGDDDVIKFENSQTLNRLLARNGLEKLPDLQRTSDEMDVRQAQLLGISRDGDAVWGVPDKGEIRHLSDDELEAAFVDQYGKKMDSHDIPLPDLNDEPLLESDGYSFFDQMADDFNQQWNDEGEMMQASAPSEYDAPPLPDESDVPPLSFDGLDESVRLHEM